MSNVTFIVNKHNIDALLDNGDLFAAMQSGAWWRMRRNGATKRWKRDASRIKVPFKVGMYGYGSITETDFDEYGQLKPDLYRHAIDVPAKAK